MHWTTVKKSSHGRWKIQLSGIIGEPGPPWINSRTGLAGLLPRTLIHCLMPPMSTALISSMPPGAIASVSAIVARAVFSGDGGLYAIACLDTQLKSALAIAATIKLFSPLFFPIH
jgi:hypothetical protein